MAGEYEPHHIEPHHIHDDLGDTWLEDFAAAGVSEIEAYLAKYAAFHAFLDSEDK